MSVLFDAHTRKDDLPGLVMRYPGKVNIFDEETPYNDLDLQGEPPAAHALTTSRHLLEGQGLLPGTIDFFSDQITIAYRKNGVLDGSDKYPVLPELYDDIASIKPRDNMMKYYKTVVCEKLRAVILAFGRSLEYREGLDFRHLQDMNNIFVLRANIPPSVRRFRVLGQMNRYFAPRQRASFEAISRMPLRCCVIDDSAEVFDNNLERHADPPPIKDMLSLSRQYRICYCFATQYPELLGRSAWDNHSSSFCYQLPSQESRKKVGELFGSARIGEDRRIREARLDFLQHMEPCSGVARLPRHRSPVPEVVSPIDIRSMTPEQKRLAMESFWREHPPVPWTPPKPLEKPVLSDDAKRLIMQAFNHPDYYTTEHYQALGWSLATGTRIRESLNSRQPGGRDFLGVRVA